MKELRSFASCEKTWKQGAAVLASSARSLKAPKTCSLYPQRMSDCFPLNCAQGDGMSWWCLCCQPLLRLLQHTPKNSRTTPVEVIQEHQQQNIKYTVTTRVVNKLWTRNPQSSTRRTNQKHRTTLDCAVQATNWCQLRQDIQISVGGIHDQLGSMPHSSIFFVKCRIFFLVELHQRDL